MKNSRIQPKFMRLLTLILFIGFSGLHNGLTTMMMSTGNIDRTEFRREYNVSQQDVLAELTEEDDDPEIIYA